MNPEQNDCTAVIPAQALMTTDAINETYLKSLSGSLIAPTKVFVDNLTRLFEQLHANPDDIAFAAIFNDDVLTSYPKPLPGLRQTPAGGTVRINPDDPSISLEDRRNYIRTVMIPNAADKLIFALMDDNELRQHIDESASEFYASLRALQCAVHKYRGLPI